MGFAGSEWGKRQIQASTDMWCSHGAGGRGRGNIELFGSCAALTHIDDSHDDPLVTWRDEVSESAEMGRREDVRNVWARVSDVETHANVAR